MSTLLAGLSLDKSLPNGLCGNRCAGRLALALIEQGARALQLAAGVDHAQGGAVGELDTEAVVELKDVVERQPLDLQASKVAVVRLGQRRRWRNRFDRAVSCIDLLAQLARGGGVGAR